MIDAVLPVCKVQAPCLTLDLLPRHTPMPPKLHQCPVMPCKVHHAAFVSDSYYPDTGL